MRDAKTTNTIESLNHEARLIAFHRCWFRRFEEILDRAEHGPTWLKDERIAKLVADSLKYRDNQVFRLDAYCVMSNHVHVVIKPLLGKKNVRLKLDAKRVSYESTEPPLGVIMHSLKSYTANEANKLLKRSGAFWETESYDHVIKDENEYYRTIAYVLNNPVKAGLV